MGHQNKKTRRSNRNVASNRRLLRRAITEQTERELLRRDKRQEMRREMFLAGMTFGEIRAGMRLLEGNRGY